MIDLESEWGPTPSAQARTALEELLDAPASRALEELFRLRDAPDERMSAGDFLDLLL